MSKQKGKNKGKKKDTKVQEEGRGDLAFVQGAIDLGEAMV